MGGVNMWGKESDASMKAAMMNDYADALYFTFSSAAVGLRKNASDEERVYPDVWALITPLKDALDRFNNEEFPVGGGAM
jgi:hypothetical protein